MTDEILAPIRAVATWRGTFEPTDPEWHEIRKHRIGGSEIGAIVGESRYESAYSLWAKKLGLIADNREDNEFMEWGRLLEPVIIDKFESNHPELKVIRKVGTWTNNEYDFMLANPDALYQLPNGELGVLEIKTARYMDDWQEGVPRYYQTQVQWYLQALKLKHATIAVLFAGSDYREYEISADAMWQHHDLERVKEFLACVAQERKPEWDGSEATVTAVRQIHPNIIPNSSVELGDLGMYYDLALREAEEQKAKVNQLQAMVLDAMGSAREGLVHDIPVFIRSARNGGTPYITRKRAK